MSISSSVISLVVFFALVWQIPAASSAILTPFWHQEAPLLYTSLRTIESPSDYQHAVQRFRGSFTYSSTKDLYAHPFLPDQTGIHEAPDMWLPIHLWGWDGDEVTLLFRDDNMNLAGFCNKSGTWFSFKDSEHLIPGSIPIGFRANFQDLLGGWTNLNKIPLGKDALKLAVRNLSSGFDPSTSSASEKGQAKVSVAQLLVMFPGALQFFPIRQKVMDGWESGCFLEDLAERALLVSWKGIMVSLVKWNETNQWEEPLIPTSVIRRYKIENEQDALGVVDLLFVPRHDSGFSISGVNWWAFASLLCPFLF